MSVLLALLLFWTAPTQDCRGGPEAEPLSYEVLLFEARVIAYQDDPQFGRLALYSRTVQAPRTGGTSLTIPDPMALSVGDVTYIGEPVSIDGAGNRSDGPCQ